MIYFTNTIWYEVLFIFHHIPAVITLELAMGVQENLCKSRVHGLSKSKQPFTQHLLLFSMGADANREAVEGSWPCTEKQAVEPPHIWVSRVSPSKADDTTARLPAHQAIEAAQKAVDSATGVPNGDIWSGTTKKQKTKAKTNKKNHNAS